MIARRRLRIRKSELAGASGLIVVLLPAALLVCALLIVGVSVDHTMGIVGGLLAVGTFAVAQYQYRRPRTRSVVFLAKSRSSFAHNIFRGLTNGLEQYGDIHVHGLFPPKDGQDGAPFQLESLKSLVVARAHAIVLIPATEDHEVWQELGRATNRGTLVVCVDTKPAKDNFHAHGLPSPAFVGSDFTLGGEMLGRYLVNRLNDCPDARLVVALGPEVSWPARERAGRILYELGRAEMLSRCETVELDNWVISSCAEKLLRAIESRLAEDCKEVFVFAGNDKLTFELDLQLDRHQGEVGKATVWLIGYDGTTTDDGSLLLEGLRRVVATVDALPVEQGLAAAEFLIAAYEGNAPHVTKRIVRPQLTYFENLCFAPDGQSQPGQ